MRVFLYFPFSVGKICNPEKAENSSMCVALGTRFHAAWYSKWDSLTFPSSEATTTGAVTTVSTTSETTSAPSTAETTSATTEASTTAVVTTTPEKTTTEETTTVKTTSEATSTGERKFASSFHLRRVQDVFAIIP